MVTKSRASTSELIALVSHKFLNRVYEQRMSSEATATLDISSTTVKTRRDMSLAAVVDCLLIPITAVIVLLFTLPILSYPPGRDQGEYLELGRSLLQGKQLYLQLWDNKPPGIFLTYAVIVRIFGQVMWSVALVDVLLILGISYFLFRYTERYLGRAGAALTVIVNAIWLSGTRYFWIAQPETFQIVCVTATFVLLRSAGRQWKLRCFASGLICGFGFWQKYNFIAFLPLLLFVPFLATETLEGERPHFALEISWNDWLRRAGFVLSGFASMIAAVFGWIVFLGAWPAMRESQFEVLPRYAAMAAQRNPHYLLTSVVRIYWFLGPATVVATLAAIVIAWRGRDLRRFLPVFLAAASALGSVVLQARFHDYYFQVCYPFFAALWGYLVIRLYEVTRALATSLQHKKQKVATVLLWILFANILFWPVPDQLSNLWMRYVQFQEWLGNRQAFYANYPDQLPFELLHGQLEVVHYIQAHTTADEPIYLWGSNSLIYFLAEKKPPTRFVLNMGVMADWGKPSWKDEVARGVKSAKPRLIIVTKNDALPQVTYVNMDSASYLQNNFAELNNYIVQNYRPAAELKDFVIYTRN